MANTLTNILPKILARGLMTLREQAQMARLVNGDYSADAALKGSTIDVPIPVSMAASAVTAQAAPVQSANYNMGLVQISLNQWFEAGFFLTDKDLADVDRNEHFMPAAVGNAVRAIANQISSTVAAGYLGIYGFTGSAGSTPFSSVVDATNARKVLGQQLCPLQDRRAVLDYSAEANMLSLAAFSDVEKVGERGPKIEGAIGRKFGFDWYTDDNVLTHTAGTMAAAGGGATVTSTTAAGASAIGISGASVARTIVVGDIFTIAGDSQTYVVTGGATTLASNDTDKQITFDPPLKAIATAADALTFKATHVVNLAFHRDCFALAMRPLRDVTTDLSLGSEIIAMTDPVTGLSMRLEVSRQRKQTNWSVDALWGAKLIRPEFGCRIAG